jgi:integrase
MNLIKPLINIDELILIAKQHHNKTRYYNIKHYRHCFTGNYENDIKNANEVIDKTLNHNTANNREHSFKWGFDQLYENEFNHKHIHHRPNFPSHFTTRLDKNEINFIKAKFEEYIKYDHLSVLVNKWNALKYSHLRIYHCFLTLIQSGMRVGELVSIDFRADPGRRQMHSILHKDTMVEIVINTLKTKKKREIYVPLASYNFFKNDKRKLSRDLVIDGFTTFAR